MLEFSLSPPEMLLSSRRKKKGGKKKERKESQSFPYWSTYSILQKAGQSFVSLVAKSSRREEKEKPNCWALFYIYIYIQTIIITRFIYTTCSYSTTSIPETLYCIEVGTHNTELCIQRTARVSGFIVPTHLATHCPPRLGPTRHMLGRLGNKQGAEGSLLSILTIIIVITLIISATPSGVEERASSLFFLFSWKALLPGDDRVFCF